MDAELKLLTTHAEVRAAIDAGIDWCERLVLATPALDSHHGRGSLWATLLRAGSKLERAYVGLELLRSEPHALEELLRQGKLRLVPAADGSFRPNLLRFYRGSRVRVLLGSGALLPAGLRAPVEATMQWEGPEFAPFSAQVDRLFQTIAGFAHLPSRGELHEYADEYLPATELREQLEAVGARFVRRTAADAEVGTLQVVHKQKEVAAAMRWIRETMETVATTSVGQRVGHQGGGGEVRIHWCSPLGIWCCFERADNRTWNAFGDAPPAAERSLQITVEINVPHSGVDRKIGAAFARDPSSGKLYLVHRGRIGGGQKGVGADLFWSRFRGGVPMTEPDRDEPSRVVVVGELESDAFPRELAAFVHEVARIKRSASK